ncbi:hypothetical protein KL86DPRO_50315 [uncultured delta proteobacterium]|uniref:HTH gntR-type domain-containing protein n=1 Tax=uncultured delta proteobacterium TaxID=34034 RepID=A0A212KDZ7_9DELT|nr:hypothetical protein KL86DPRO_50315 [uncultured delta proteobacterium]
MLPKIGHKQSLSDHAYTVIKEAILNNTFKPKDILLEESIAEMLGISRTPLRTALKRLEFEKLIFINSQSRPLSRRFSRETWCRFLSSGSRWSRSSPAWRAANGRRKTSPGSKNASPGTKWP